MKNYKVTLSHIVGYYEAIDEESEPEPRLKLTEVIVFAESENAAMEKAQKEDPTRWSVYEIYADEAED